MELQGQSLTLTVSVLTSLGFMLIGYDNGLMGGLVNTTAFKDTFNDPNADMIGVIVAIFEGMLVSQKKTPMISTHI
jgi:ammonia channel protein AmtB